MKWLKVLILPLGIALVIKMVPKELWQACQQQASDKFAMETLYRTQVVIFILLIWLITLTYIGFICWDWYLDEPTYQVISQADNSSLHLTIFIP